MSGSLLTSPTLTALSDRPTARAISRRSFTIRFLVAANLLLGAFYLSWRYTSSINWQYWPIALCLVAAETYSYLDAWLFGLTMWRLRVRGEPLPYPERATTDVFITCYNEPVELVRKTARAAVGIRYPHQTSEIVTLSSAC
jgi:cellulose synthase (UDP-forming)